MPLSGLVLLNAARPLSICLLLRWVCMVITLVVPNRDLFSGAWYDNTTKCGVVDVHLNEGQLQLASIGQYSGRSNRGTFGADWNTNGAAPCGPLTVRSDGDSLSIASHLSGRTLIDRCLENGLIIKNMMGIRLEGPLLSLSLSVRCFCMIMYLVDIINRVMFSSWYSKDISEM